MRRASFTSSILSRTLSTVHDGGTVNLHPRLRVALFSSSRADNSNSRRHWFFPLLNSFSKSSGQAVSLGLVGVVASVATAAVYAKEPPPAKSSQRTKKEIKWSDYKKVPILMVDGQQLVDSSAIIDQLSEKILPGKAIISVADEDEETKWRRSFFLFLSSYELMILYCRTLVNTYCCINAIQSGLTNHLVHVLSPNIYRNTSEALESFDYITSNGNFSFTEKITVKYAGAAAMYFVSKNLKKKYNITDERAALYEATETWVDALNGRNFLGGSKPNLADLAVFGVLRPIRYLRSGRDMVEHTRIGEWYSRMEKVVGEPSRIKA
ncbi:hypothetical protein ES288_A03G114200v1 [Gossypium darwinii]|uniref:GST C-terminal domain-containing protein n=1 Tax=Gossypium darwinii TaxID=34276 RepID=A0A5D2H3H3_GOSDA|nr:hypothetical protein ES288_A03G114200v1 [Gossypium darwinii]